MVLSVFVLTKLTGCLEAPVRILDFMVGFCQFCQLPVASSIVAPLRKKGRS